MPFFIVNRSIGLLDPAIGHFYARSVRSLQVAGTDSALPGRFLRAISRTSAPQHS